MPAGNETGSVPIIDLRTDELSDPAVRADIAQQIGAACTDLGFLVVSNHGVAADTITNMLEVTQRFFALPLADKQRCSPADRYIFRGYFGIRTSALAGSLDVETPPDLCEGFAINRFDDPAAAIAAGNRPGREGFFAPNIWPDIVGFREAWTAYYTELEALCGRLLSLMASALDLEPDWFDDKVGQHISNLLANHYPSQPEPPLPGQLRRGAHTDYGSLTILYQDANPGGLQVQRRDGSWADVPHVPGTFVANLGDLMATWTNDRWVSTMHRVVNPDREQAHRDRISLAFFHQPDYDAVIECIPTCVEPGDTPRHPPTTSGQWVLDKLRKSVSA